jgi:anti-sigma regulatory factor (Ser/Thr protein kinase)
MSTEPANVFETRFQNHLPELISAMEAAVRFLNENGVKSEAVHTANLAIEELTTNTLKYGYDDNDAHEILLRVELLPDRVRLFFEDDGHEFNPLLRAEPDVNLPVEERGIGGLGIHLVRRFAQEMDYERRDGRNRLTVAIRR